MATDTAHRVAENTARHVNAEIRRRTEESVARHAAGGPEAINRRLVELDREWDVERTLEFNFALVVLVGLALGAAVSWWWALLPGVAALFMVQHVLQGWCPPVPIFRRLGIRTQTEIDYERYALKALRGDFQNLPTYRDGNAPIDAHQALEAAVH